MMKPLSPRTRIDRTIDQKIKGLILVLALGAGAVVSGCMGSMGAPPVPADCKPLSSRTCSCDTGDIGVETCTSDGLAWGDCRCSCTPLETEECECGVGQHGIRECAPTGEYWLACQCLDEGEELEHHVEELQDPSCGVGEVNCPGVGCVNLGNDADNCGLCGRACEGCDRCFLGACTTVCCADETNCGTELNPICSDLDSDGANCGVCGLACGDGQICVQGSCQ
jgi:hypothetical protein